MSGAVPHFKFKQPWRKPRTCFQKQTDLKLTAGYLNERADRCIGANYGVPKWIIFCRTLLQEGYHCRLYEARKTVSKYITVTRPGVNVPYKVRFSNHAPIKKRELAGDCDFFVGMCNLKTTTTFDALDAVRAFFDKKLEKQIVQFIDSGAGI